MKRKNKDLLSDKKKTTKKKICFKDAQINKTENYLKRKKKILGHYQVDKLLGHGEYGMVWRGKDARDRQVKAIKGFFNPELDLTFFPRAGILREISFYRSFSHPSLLYLHEIFLCNLTLWVVLPICFKPLNKWLQEN